MPIQPMKAMATIAVAENLPLSQMVGAGFMLGGFFLFLALTNSITLIGRIVPNSVIRGIQLGLGVNLILVAFRLC